MDQLIYSVEVLEVLVVGKVFEGDGVGLVVDGESDLDEEVYDYQIMSMEFVWGDFKSVGDDQIGLGDGVVDVEELDEGDLGVFEVFDFCFVGGFEVGSNNCLCQEEQQYIQRMMVSLYFFQRMILVDMLLFIDSGSQEEWVMIKMIDFQ